MLTILSAVVEEYVRLLFVSRFSCLEIAVPLAAAAFFHNPGAIFMMTIDFIYQSLFGIKASVCCWAGHAEMCQLK